MIRERPLGIVTAVDAVADELRNQVLSNVLPPGSPLREAILAKELGVGRHTLRAALSVLVHEGLLVRVTNRGVYVPRLTNPDIIDLYLVRSALETEVARQLAMRRILPDRAAKWLLEMEALPPDAPWARVVEADLGFHGALVAAVDSPRLQAVYRSVALEARLSLSQLRPVYAEPSGLAAEHRILLDSIGSFDPSIAVAETRRHLSKAVDDLTAPRERRAATWSNRRAR